MSEWCKTWRLILSGIFMYHKGDWSLSLLRAEFRLTSGGHSYILVRLIAFLEDQIIVHSSNCLWCRKRCFHQRRGEESWVVAGAEEKRRKTRRRCEHVHTCGEILVFFTCSEGTVNSGDRQSHQEKNYRRASTVTKESSDNL